ncbi:MAG TPA: nuclear transport factor 2 family protein [Actinomycetes bacterium]|nr:nuclear transport factor 2 family protein [Actinomycetes bacterium]
MASPAEVFQALREAHAKADAKAAAALYASDAVYYEPDNQPHRGRDEIRNYLAAYFARRGPVEVTVKREVHADSSVLAEWTSAYTEAGRRWSGTPGVSVIELGREGISYHRDYQ